MLRVLNCTAMEEAMIQQAARVALAKLANGVCGLDGLDRLRRCIMERLNGVQPLTVMCSDCEDVPADAFNVRGASQIGICRSALAGDQQRLNSVFFHELIHACGGDELDSEGLEGHCFRDGGATSPSPMDFQLFRGYPVVNGYVSGSFLLWDPQTGKLFVKGANGVSPGAPLGIGFRNPQGF